MKQRAAAAGRVDSFSLYNGRAVEIRVTKVPAET
jgi:hypothetical protein